MRGIMNFDDYSYRGFNSYVLLPEPHESEKRRVIKDRKAIMSHTKKVDHETSSNLTQDLLDKKEVFSHDLIKIAPIMSEPLKEQEPAQQSIAETVKSEAPVAKDDKETAK